jgi:hypothetical protein
VEAALTVDASHTAVLATLHAQGFTFTLRSFESTLGRLRKERQGLDANNALSWGRPNSRVTSRHFSQGKARRVLMSNSKRPYGLTCSQISGVSAA